ncbi:hypothetical protein PIB30_092499, partial [Stylosanthes scabra]|nr:hypothetical protein [Stylosanthes scabra]
MRTILRICVATILPFLHQFHSLTHPNYHVLYAYASSLRICVATLLFHPFNPFAIHQPRICVPSYVYAWDTHTHTPHFISPSQPKHPHHPRICVQLYAYAWNPRLHSTPSSPHRKKKWRHTFRSFVRGVPVDFSPENIRTVMHFRAQVQGATTDFETRKEHDQQLDRVLADLCMPRATWKLSTGKLRVPIQLRRQELNPVARGWHEFSIHSLIPSSNRSEIPVIRAILIHCIMRGEDVRAEDIIADKIVRMAQGIKEKGKLGFPSTIYKLCKEAGVPLREFRRTRKIQAEKPITARRMESTRLPRPVQRRQQEDEEEDEPMPQAGEVNEEENVEQQGDDHDYHYQHDYEQQQPEYEQHRLD